MGKGLEAIEVDFVFFKGNVVIGDEQRKFSNAFEIREIGKKRLWVFVCVYFRSDYLNR